MNDIIRDPAEPGLSSNARVEVILHRLLPEGEEPNEIIGHYSERLVQEIKRRGSYPMIRLAWPEDFELLTSARAAQIAARVANDNLAEDPIVSAIAEQVAQKAPQVALVPTPPFLMKLEDYANRCGYSVTFIKRLIPRGLPTLGVHKARRVHVARADKWLEGNLDVLDVTDSEDVSALARANAHKKGAR